MANASKKPPEECITQLYIRCSSPRPDKHELARSRRSCLRPKDLNQALEDIFWALLNSRELLSNPLIRETLIMRSKLSAAFFSALVSLCLGAFSANMVAETPKEKITYQDNVAAIFRNRCGSCHNPDKQKGG